MTHELTSAPALLSGSAQRISASDKALANSLPLCEFIQYSAQKAWAKTHALEAKPAILRATIQITRAATGKVEEYEIVGTADQHLNEGA
jgi:hypothetical protein